MKKLSLCLCSAIVAVCSYGQVMYTNVSPARVLNGTASPNQLDSVKMHPAHPLSHVIGSDSALHLWHFDPAAPFSNDVGADCRGTAIELLKGVAGQLNTFQAAALDSGFMIDATAGTWERPNYIRLAIEKANDNWDNMTDKYLAVRFNRAGQWYYSWIKMSIDATPTKCEIKGYAYEATTGKGIVAGNKGSGSGTGISASAALDEVRIGVRDKTIRFFHVNNSLDISIWDMNGRVVYTGNINAGNNSISLGHVPAGMYIVRMQSGGATMVKKIVL